MTSEDKSPAWGESHKRLGPRGDPNGSVNLVDSPSRADVARLYREELG